MASTSPTVRTAAKAALYWLECAELARQQGDAPAEAYAQERAGFASNKAFNAIPRQVRA
jgi:hypothetical protein